jgi:hypothetical protein
VLEFLLRNYKIRNSSKNHYLAMYSRTFLPFFLILLQGLFFTNCGDDASQKEESLSSKLQGSWDLKKAFRDKKQTVALENTFFEFGEEGAMKTNFNVDMKTESQSFTLKNNILHQVSENTDKQTYHIYEASDTSLTLQTRYKGYEFKLIMEKRLLEGPE